MKNNPLSELRTTYNKLEYRKLYDNGKNKIKDTVAEFPLIAYQNQETSEQGSSYSTQALGVADSS